MKRGGRESDVRTKVQETQPGQESPQSNSPDNAAANPAARTPSPEAVHRNCPLGFNRYADESVHDDRIRALEAELADGYCCHVMDHARFEDEKQQAWAEARHATDRAEEAEAELAAYRRGGRESESLSKSGSSETVIQDGSLPKNTRPEVRIPRAGVSQADDSGEMIRDGSGRGPAAANPVMTCPLGLLPSEHGDGTIHDDRIRVLEAELAILKEAIGDKATRNLEGAVDYWAERCAKAEAEVERLKTRLETHGESLCGTPDFMDPDEFRDELGPLRRELAREMARAAKAEAELAIETQAAQDYAKLHAKSQARAEKAEAENVVLKEAIDYWAEQCAKAEAEVERLRTELAEHGQDVDTDADIYPDDREEGR